MKAKLLNSLTVAAQTSDSSVAAPEAAYQTYLPLTVKHADHADGGDDGGGNNEAGAI